MITGEVVYTPTQTLHKSEGVKGTYKGLESLGEFTKLKCGLMADEGWNELEPYKPEMFVRRCSKCYR